MAHEILEIAAVPRKTAELKALIADARKHRRKSKLMRIVAAILVVVALAILVLHGCSTTPTPSYDVFLPIIMYNDRSEL